MANTLATPIPPGAGDCRARRIGDQVAKSEALQGRPVIADQPVFRRTKRLSSGLSLYRHRSTAEIAAAPAKLTGGLHEMLDVIFPHAL